MHQPLTLTLLADQPLLVALVAVVLEMVLPLPASVRPSALVPLLERLARKVNYRQSPPAQQWVAGLLTPLVVLIPSVAGCWALRNLTLSETLFDLLLLCWLLEGRPLRQQLAGMLPLLRADKLVLARRQLSPLVRRETDRLSLMGICKATSEQLILRWSGQWACVLFWYLVAGIEAALVIRLLQLMTQAFSVKLPRQRLFGEPTATLYRVLSGLPAILNTLVLGMLPGGGHALRAAWRARRDWPGGAQGMLVAAVAGGLGLRLGGPRFYAGEKVRYPILGGGPGGGAEPQADSPLRVRSRLRWLAAIWLLLSLLMEGLWLYVYTR